MTTEMTHVAFSGSRQVAAGTLRDVLPILKDRFDGGRPETILVFEVESGRQVDFDLRGGLDEILERAAPAPSVGPGRPRLGVKSREISLLPRHWDWLEQQPQGISAAIRRLVEHAMKNQPGKERARRIRAALSQVLSPLAGNRPNYEEACRSLFAGETDRFAALIKRWPKDVREFALTRARAAAEADASG